MIFIKKLLVGVFTIALVVILSFYLLIVVGLNENLQSLWVTTTMTTANYKWLSTSLMSEEKIEKILEEWQVKDDGIKNSKIDFVKVSKEYDGYKFDNGVYYKFIKGIGWKGHLMLVDNPKKINLAVTDKLGKEGQTVSEMVESYGALAGVNGGAFIEKSDGGIASGYVVRDSSIISHGDNGHRIIGFDNDGSLRLGYGGSKWINENSINNAVTFGPFLVVDGKGLIHEGNGGWGIAPRTVIGQRKSGEVIFLVVDGRNLLWSVGIDLKIAQDIMIQEGCINAAMLDGGSSSTMVIGGSVINKPSDGTERKVNNSWVIMP